MQTRSSIDLLFFDTEVERIVRRNNSLKKKRKTLERLARLEPNSLVLPNMSGGSKCGNKGISHWIGPTKQVTWL